MTDDAIGNRSFRKKGDIVLKGGFWKVSLGVTLSILITLPWFVFRDRVSEFVQIGYGGLFVTCLLANMVVVIPVSSTASVIVASSILNPILCVFIGSLAAALGEHTSYLLGRFGWRSSDVVSKISSNHVLYWLYQHKHAVLISAAFFPSSVSDVFGMIAGLCKIPWCTFAMSVWIGKLFKYGLTVLLFYGVLPWLTSFLDSPFREWVKSFSDFIVYPRQ